MIYMSPNISRFGYAADEFISGRIMFRDILYKGDFERTLQEIKHYVDNNIDTYTQVYRKPGTLTDILTEMNRHLTEDVYATGRFMTLFCLPFSDEPERSIRWIRAGHDPALLYDSTSGQFEELKGPGLALGVDRE